MKQGNICVPGKVTNATSTQSKSTVSLDRRKENNSGNGTIQKRGKLNITLENASMRVFIV